MPPLQYGGTEGTETSVALRRRESCVFSCILLYLKKSVLGQVHSGSHVVFKTYVIYKSVLGFKINNQANVSALLSRSSSHFPFL